MRTFAKKEKVTPQTASGTKAHVPAFSGHSLAVRSILHLQRTIGNRAVQRLLVQRDDTDIDYAAEYASFAAKDHVSDGLAGFRDIRDLLVDKFGSIAAANTYYREVKGADFLGGRVTVHTTLGAQLKKAEDLLKAQGWYDAIVAAAPRIGGFNVRRNRNRRSALSDHSFGWAIDIDAALNPNMNDFPARAVMAVTGEGISTGATMEKINAGGTAEDLLGSIGTIRTMSDEFKDAFRDETSLEGAMRNYLKERVKFEVDADFPLLDKVKAAARGRAARKELAEHLKENWTSLGETEQWQEAEDREAIVAAKGWRAWKKEKEKRKKASEKAEAAFWKERKAAAKKIEELRTAGKTDEEINKLVNEPYMAAQAKLFDTQVMQMADKAAGTLIEMWKIYVRSFERGKTEGGARVAAQTEGTAGTVAAHGFMNMPSTLAAALIGSDGGNLDWLGAASVRDFMHFQLKPGDRPST